MKFRVMSLSHSKKWKDFITCCSIWWSKMILGFMPEFLRLKKESINLLSSNVWKNCTMESNLKISYFVTSCFRANGSDQSSNQNRMHGTMLRIVCSTWKLPSSSVQKWSSSKMYRINIWTTSFLSWVEIFWNGTTMVNSMSQIWKRKNFPSSTPFANQSVPPVPRIVSLSKNYTTFGKFSSVTMVLNGLQMNFSWKHQKSYGQRDINYDAILLLEQLCRRVLKQLGSDPSFWNSSSSSAGQRQQHRICKPSSFHVFQVNKL